MKEKEYKGKIYEEYTRNSTGEIVEIASYRTPQQDVAYESKKKKDRMIDDYESVAGRNFSFWKSDGISNYKDAEDNFRVFGAIIKLSAFLPMDGSNKLPQRTQQELADAIGVSRQMVNEIIDKAVKFGLMSIDDGYCLNPDIVYRGKLGKDINAVRVYHKAIKSFDMSLSNVGFLFLVLPYVSYDHWVLAYNPDCQNMESMVGMNMNNLAEVLGINKATISRKIKSMVFKYDDTYMSVFGEFKNVVSGKKHLLINPMLVSRKPSDEWKKIVNLFVLSDYEVMQKTVSSDKDYVELIASKDYDEPKKKLKKKKKKK